MNLIVFRANIYALTNKHIVSFTIRFIFHYFFHNVAYGVVFHSGHYNLKARVTFTKDAMF